MLTGQQLSQYVNKCVSNEEHYTLVVGDNGLSNSKKNPCVTLKCKRTVKSRCGNKSNREQTSSKFVHEDDQNVCTFRICVRFNRCVHLFSF